MMTNVMEEVLRTGTAGACARVTNLDGSVGRQDGKRSHDGWFGRLHFGVHVHSVGGARRPIRKLELEGAHSPRRFGAGVHEARPAIPRVPRRQAVQGAERHRLHRYRSALGNERPTQASKTRPEVYIAGTDRWELARCTAAAEA